MMEPGEDRERDDVALVGALRQDRRLLAESLVRACADVLTDGALEVPVIEHHYVVGIPTPYCPKLDRPAFCAKCARGEGQGW